MQPAKCNFTAFVQEKLNKWDELPIPDGLLAFAPSPPPEQVRFHSYLLPDVRDKEDQLRSRHEAKYIGPSFQGKFTKFRKIKFNLAIYIYIFGSTICIYLCALFSEILNFNVLFMD
jgi:hypothetical protein